MLLKSPGVAVLTVVLAAGPLAVITASSDEVQLFETLGWATVTSIQTIDTEVVAALRSRMGADPRISDPGGPFNPTDVVTGEPTRRLLVAGRAGTRWFVAYEHGGRGHHIILVVFDKGATGLNPTLLARGNAGKHDRTGWHVSLADLRIALKSGAMTQDDVNEAYY